MAISNRNVITHGLSGKVGDLVLFSQRFGATVMGKIPVRKKEPTARQLAVQEKFRLAAAYAKACLLDPQRKAIYAQRAGGGVTAFNLAFSDFHYAPVINDIIVAAYTGLPGSTIGVQATDDTKVTDVTVSITNPSGTLLEEGPAALNPENGHWIYTTTMANATLAGSKVSVTVKDIPGNMTTDEKTV
jgi:hypothetical protein